MKKELFASIAVAACVGLTSEPAKSASAHSFEFEAIGGGRIELAEFAGKAVLVVNTASFCGFTKQYEGLQKLWDSYRDQGLVVLGVPSNDFGGQEPKSNQEIKEFCEVTFNVDFPLTSKAYVRGSQSHPFYAWARGELGAQAAPRWNFHKYLVAPDGRLVAWFSTDTEPESAALANAIELHLPAD